MFRYLGAKVTPHVYLFGDNASVVQSGSIPHSRLNKRHIALSYHFVREAIASGLLKFGHIPGEDNAADILSKHWSYAKIWPMLQPLLFFEGNTIHTLYKTKNLKSLPPSLASSDSSNPDKPSPHPKQSG